MSRRPGGEARWRTPIVAAVTAGVVALACVPTRGGWDAEAILAERPDLAALPGQRLGDLTPYPALPGDSGRDPGGGPPSLWLVACRYAPDTRLELRAEGVEWPAEWATAALGALDVERFGLHAEIARSGPSGEEGTSVAPVPGGSARIEIESIGSATAPGPVGLGDTLTLCDVSARDGVSARSTARPTGELVGGRIRLRRRLPQPTGRVHEATREEWVAAFLHEFAHALGFAGHAASGDSPVHREQGALRGLARRALRGEVVAAPNLRALYGLAPGRILGRVSLTRDGADMIARVERAVAERSARVGPAEGPLASVGDVEARLAWRWTDGQTYDVRFPRYVEALRKGEPVHAEAGPRTLRAWASRGGPRGPAR